MALVGKSFGVDQWASTLDDVWGAETTNLSLSLVRTTGATTDRSLADRFADVKNVKDFGAVGDDSTDDTAAFQAAINAAGSGGTVFMPNGIYKITSSLNLQNLIGVSVIGTGVETQVHGVFSNKAVFDCLGADRLIFKDFWLNGDATTYPDAGFLLSRPVSNASSGTHHFENVWTVGCWNKAALVGISSEGNTYVGGQFRNELSGRAIICVGSTNMLSMTSAFATVPASPSGGNTVHRFLGTYFAYTPVDRAAGADGVILESIRDISFHGCFFQGAGSKGLRVVSGIVGLNIAGGETEWSGDQGIYVDAGAIADLVVISGFYSDRPIYAGAGAGFTNSKLHGNFNYEVSGPGPQGCMDVDILKYSEVTLHGHPASIRTTCLGNIFVDGMLAGSASSGITFPAGASGNIYGESVLKSDGNTYYRWKIGDEGTYSRLETHMIKADVVQTTVQSTSASAESGTFAPNLGNGSVVYVTLDQNLTVNVPTGAHSTGDNGYEDGAELTFFFKQDGTGSRVVTFASAANTYAVKDWIADPAPNSLSCITFRLDPNSASWVQTGGYPNNNLQFAGTLSPLIDGQHATASLGAGNISLNNGTADAPGIHFYTDDNKNYGIDAVDGVGLRFSFKLDETGGSVNATLNEAGAFTVPNGPVVAGQGLIPKNGLGATIYAGNGSPEGVVSASPGSVYLNVDAGTGTTLYVKETAPTASTGWVAK